MEKVISYTFTEAEQEIVKTFLYKASADPCYKCPNVSCLVSAQCNAKKEWERKYNQPFRNIFNSETVEILASLLEYKNYLTELDELEEKLKQHRKRRYKILTQLPLSIVEAIEVPCSLYS